MHFSEIARQKFKECVNTVAVVKTENVSVNLIFCSSSPWFVLWYSQAQMQSGIQTRQ